MYHTWCYYSSRILEQSEQPIRSNIRYCVQISQDEKEQPPAARMRRSSLGLRDGMFLGMNRPEFVCF
jgi:hypothetical protein